MSSILCIYSSSSYHEVLLPAIDDSDYDLVLSRDIYGLSIDVILKMEIIEGGWRFLPDPSYSIVFAKNNRSCEEQILHDDDMLTATIFNEGRLFIVIKKTDASFTVYKKYDLSGVSSISVGSDIDNQMQYNRRINENGLISGKHAAIVRRSNGFVLIDNSKNGSFVNDKRISNTECVLEFGDTINIYGLKMVYLDGILAVNTNNDGLVIRSGFPAREFIARESEEHDASRDNTDKSLLFRRSPRNIPKIETEPVEIEAPPAAKENVTQSGFMAIGPSLTMALPMLLGTGVSIAASTASSGHFNFMMISGIITAIGSAGIGTFWAIRNMKAQKKKNREEEVKRFEVYKDYLIRCADEIKDKYDNNTKALYQMYHSSDQCSAIGREDIELWNRNTRHDDFLKHRVGLGRIPFQVEIVVPKERFSMIKDNLNERPRMIRESYRSLENVPVCVDLNKNKLIGVIGGEGYRGCYQVMNDLVAQIASSDCYTDVKLAFVYDENGGGNELNWKYAKWLPHVWSSDGKVRYYAGNRKDASDVFYELTNILRFRAEDKQANNFAKNMVYNPYYILFLENPELLEGELLSKYVYNTDENYGLTTILMVHSYDELPNACEYIIENTDRYKGAYYVTDGEDDRVGVKYDLVDSNKLEKMARRLSDIKVKEEVFGGEIPASLTFFEMYGINRVDELQVLDRWKKNRTYDSLRALIGQKSGGAECYLDVHEKYHGPHGLVAGTTGSGKSETLQTYMLSLAINYSPDDIGFFIIDYKGGGMANLFNGLPHMIGQISNLSGNQVRRAMVSIKSENMRRQRIFNEYGVNNINLYTRLYKNNEANIPVPHMFIIIDEFAELKREEPEFMKELISVAQVGRSLGVHLILATQKPAGTVDDNIWSNSKFRLCLRVQDKQDSMDMLHKPDAAYITQAGRGYMQVGNDELYELFQSGYSGAIYDEESGVQPDIAKMITETGKTALVGSHAQLQQKEKLRNAWIAKLIELADIAAARTDTGIAECTEDKSLVQNICREFFREAERQGIDYPETDHNLHLVREFIDVYAMCLKMPMQKGEELPQKINTMAAVLKKKLPEAEEKTQLDAVVAYLAKTAMENGYTRDLQLWLPLLPEEMYLHELQGHDNRAFNGSWRGAGKRFSLDTYVGLYDDPENQAQNPVTVDVAECGNVAVVGMPMTGKSTFILTLLYSLAECYSPDMVNFYVIDFSSKMLGGLSTMPHTGGVMFEEDGEVIEKFFTFLGRMLQERKQLFRGGNYKQYVQSHGFVLPAVVVAIDNYASFRAKTENRYDDQMLSLLKEANAYGIYFVLSAGGYSASEIPGKQSEMIRAAFALELTERFAYGEVMHTMKLEVLPETNVKGRGLAKIGETILEFQTALPLKANDDFERMENIRKKGIELSAAWTGKRAREIPTIPADPVWGDYREMDEVITMVKSGDRLPVGYDQRTASVYGLDLRNIYSYIISGKAHTGKTNMLKIICSSAVLSGFELSVFDFNGELKSVSTALNAEYVSNDQEMYDYLSALIPEFKERNTLKKECAEQDLTDKELYEKMQKFRKKIMVIGDLVEFVKHISAPGEGVGSMSGLMCNLLDKGANHNIFWFAAFNQDQIGEVQTDDIFKVFTRDRNGIHFGGNLQAQRLLSFEHVKYNEQGKKQPAGVGMLPSNSMDDTKAVVVPFYRISQ